MVNNNTTQVIEDALRDLSDPFRAMAVSTASLRKARTMRQRHAEWRLFTGSRFTAIFKGARAEVAHLDLHDGGPVSVGQFYDAEKARRAVACVNGCAGIPDPEKDIPALVAALRAFSDAHSATGEHNAHTAEHGMVELVGMARTILSRLEKEAQQE